MEITESHPIIAIIVLGLFVLVLVSLAPKITYLKCRNSGNVYKVRYKKKRDGNYEIRVLSRPTNRNTARCSNLHLLEHNVICTTKPIASRERAEFIADYWIGGYEVCLKTGHFPDEGNQSI